MLEPSAEADGKRRTDSTEIQVNIHEELTGICNKLTIGTIIAVGHNMFSGYRDALVFSIAVGFEPTVEGLFAVGLKPLLFSTGTKVPEKKGGGLPKPSAEADGKRRAYSTEIKANR